MSESFGWPSDSIDCKINKPPIGFSSKQWVTAKCNEISLRFLGVGTSVLSQEDADNIARTDAQKRAELWYESTICYAQSGNIEIIIGGDNL